ncbi:MAG: phage integrase N-terminal SAM-like domain-containing protein [Firmicutes bacterium]|nr:phage integrase N-terminal SAM-like domain-containing protein [Bacillota bacterium]
MLFSETAEKFYDYMASIERSPRTIEVYTRDLGYIRRFLEERKNGPVYTEDITQEDLEAFMRNVKEVKQYSANTRSNYFYTLRSLYAFAYKKGLVDRNIAASMDFMRMPKKERTYLIERSEIAEKLGYKNPMSLDNYMRRRNFSWDSRQKMFVLRPSATRQSCIAISCRCMVHRRRRLSSPNSRRTVRTRRKSRDKQVLPATQNWQVI